MYDCPKCHVDLRKADGNPGVYWLCPSCGGRAATVSLLRRLIPKPIMNKVWQTAWSGGYPRTRACPACGKAMAEVPVCEGDARFCLDVCTICQTIWFDSDEYESLPKKLRELTFEERLPPDARERLAMLKVEEIRARALEETDAADVDWWHWVVGFFGMPVESESGGIGIKAWVTWGAAGLVLLAGLLCFKDVSAVAERFGFIPSEYGRMWGLTFVSSFFIHADAVHLFSNLYFLVVFGDNVEEWLGWRKFLLLLFSATIAGNLLHMMLNMESAVPCVGASGGISGVLAFYALQFPRSRVRLLVRYWLKFGWVRLPAWSLFLVWIALQYLGAEQQLAGIGNVSALAHLGGVFAGLVLWGLTRRENSYVALGGPVDFTKEIAKTAGPKPKF